MDSDYDSDSSAEIDIPSLFVRQYLGMHGIHRNHFPMYLSDDNNSDDDDDNDDDDNDDNSEDDNSEDDNMSDDSSRRGCNDSQCPHCGPNIRNRRNAARRPPKSWRYLKAGKWNDAMERLATHPEEVIWRSVDDESNGYFSTPSSSVLRTAFTNVAGDYMYSEHVPMEVVDAILKAYGYSSANHPLAIGQRSAFSTQAHTLFILKFQRYEDNILSTIIEDMNRWSWEVKTNFTIEQYDNGEADDIDVEGSPSSSEQEKRLQVVQKLLCLSSSLASEGAHPLLELMDRALESSSFDLADAIADVFGEGPHALQGLYKSLYKLMNMIFYSVVYDRSWPNETTEFQHLLHCVIKAGNMYELPDDLIINTIELATEDELVERDVNGDTPLLALVKCTSLLTEQESMVNDALCNLTDNAPHISRMADKKGRLPLHLAIENGVTFRKGLDSLLSDEPDAVSIRDIQTRFYPFQMAAVGCNADLDTIYELLQYNPLLAYGLAEKPYWEHMEDLKMKNQICQQQNVVYLDTIKRNTTVQEKLHKTLQKQSDEIEMKNMEIQNLKKQVEELMKSKDGFVSSSGAAGSERRQRRSKRQRINYTM